MTCDTSIMGAGNCTRSIHMGVLNKNTVEFNQYMLDLQIIAEVIIRILSKHRNPEYPGFDRVYCKLRLHVSKEGSIYKGKYKTYKRRQSSNRSSRAAPIP